MAIAKGQIVIFVMYQKALRKTLMIREIDETPDAKNVPYYFHEIDYSEYILFANIDYLTEYLYFANVQLFPFGRIDRIVKILLGYNLIFKP
jgi:hypothetical protein